jgi:hypothetical protein
VNWKFWRRPSPTPPKELSLTLTLTPEGDVNGVCAFPRLPPDVSQKAANSFALMLHLLNSGRALPLLQKAVVAGGRLHGEMFATSVLHGLNGLEAEAASREEGDAAGRPPARRVQRQQVPEERLSD